MPIESSWDVQSGLYTSLAATDTLTDLLAAGPNGVCDHVPPGISFPYIVLGEAMARPMDTQTYRGQEISTTIHSYSRSEGMKELKNIMAAVSQSLHDASFLVDDQILVLCQEISADTFLEGDGETRHGVQRFRIITESA